MAGTRFEGEGVAIGSGAPIVSAGGTPHSGLLRVAVDVVAAQTVVIGPDTYRVAVVNTDSTKDTSGGEFNNTKAELHNVTMEAHGRVIGDLIRVESEIMVVTGVPRANALHLKRGVSGTTIAAHADALDIFVEAAGGGGGIGVGLVTTLTPTAFVAALVPDINNRGSAAVVAAAMAAAGPVLVTAAKSRGGPVAVGSEGVAYATTETLAGAGNAWDAATLGGGSDAFIPAMISIVPTAAQVTEGKIYIPTPFVSPQVVGAFVFTTTTRAYVAWAGAVTILGNVIILDNAGGVDWAATDTILLWVKE